LGVIVVAPQTPESFWARVKKTDGCWEWQGKCNVRGYGKLRWHGKMYRAHRIAAWLSGLVETPRGPSGIADTLYYISAITVDAVTRSTSFLVLSQITQKMPTLKIALRRENMLEPQNLQTYKPVRYEKNTEVRGSLRESR